MTDPIECPVLPAQRAVLQSTQALVSDLRALKKAMKNCRTCQHGANCPLVNELNAQLSDALAQAYDFYGLTANRANTFV